MSAALAILFIYTVKYYGCMGTIIVRNLTSNQTIDTFTDAEALFGSQISPYDPITGFIFAGNPLNGCTDFIHPPKNVSFIALVKRGDCFFTDKAMVAQRGNFSALVIYNDQDSIFPMSADSENLVRIPVVMVGLSDGTYIKDLYCNSSSKDYVITIIANRDTNIASFIVPVISLVGLLLLCITVYWCCRCYIHLKIRRRRCLTQAQLNTIPVINFVEDGTCDSTCPICLEEFVNQDELRLLPCRHASRAPENPEISVTVGISVTVSEYCDSPQEPNSQGFSTVQAIVHQAASPTDNEYPV